MNYSEDYFQRETIGGFEVSAMMKRCWAAQMEVLEDFDAVCRKHSIKYFLAYGTLLGAVRHKGFIPWDDDIDIWMPRTDLDRLTLIAKKELEELGLELVTPFTDDSYGNLVFRLINTKNYCLREEFLKKYWLFPFMAGLDIFTLDYVPRDENLLRDQKALMASTWILAENWNNKEMDYNEKMEAYCQLINLLGVDRVEESMISAQLWKLADRIGGLYTDEDADMVTIWGYYLRFPDRVFSKEWFKETVYLDFEGVKLPCPMGYANVLEKEFGEDYLVPKKWTADHEYPYYKDAHERLLSDFRDLGITCPEIYRHI